MIGFAVTVAAMVMTGWIVYAATYRAAYLEGWKDGHSRPTQYFHTNVPAGTLDIETATGAALDRLAGIPQRPAGMTDLELRNRIINNTNRPDWDGAEKYFREVHGLEGEALRERMPLGWTGPTKTACDITRGCWLERGHDGHCD